MKVLIVTREFPPTFVGGIANLAYYLYSFLKGMGVDIKVVAFGDEDNSSCNTIFFEPLSPITSRVDGSSLRSLLTSVDVARFSRFVNELVKYESFDVIHVIEPYVGGFIKHENKVTTMHDTSYRELCAWSKYPPGYSLKRLGFYISHGILMEVASIRTSKLIIAPSLGTARILCDIYRVPTNKIKIIPNGVALPNKVLSQLEAKKFLGLEHDTIMIFTTAHHVARKRLETLIAAAMHLKERGQEFKVVIGGEGPLTSYYESLTKKLNLEEIIVFTGWLSEDDLNKYYYACDVFVITSESEAGPITLLEASIRAKPIVTTDIAGLPALMEHQIHCLKFKVGDSRTLAKHLEALINDREARVRLGINAQRFAEKFTWDKIAYNTLQVYVELLKNRSG